MDAQFVQRYRAFIKLETPEDIEKWRQERRKNFPRFGAEKKPVSNICNFASEHRGKWNRNDSNFRRGRRNKQPYSNRQKPSFSNNQNNVSVDEITQCQPQQIVNQAHPFQTHSETFFEKPAVEPLSNCFNPSVNLGSEIICQIKSEVNDAKVSELVKPCQPIGALQNIFASYASSESEDEVKEAIVPQKSPNTLLSNPLVKKEPPQVNEISVVTSEINNQKSVGQLAVKKFGNKLHSKNKKLFNPPVRQRKLTLFEKLMLQDQQNISPGIGGSNCDQVLQT